MEWMLSRLKEPSTWKGIAVLAGIAGYSVSPEMWQSIAGVVAAVVGLIEIVRKEKTNEPKAE